MPVIIALYTSEAELKYLKVRNRTLKAVGYDCDDGSIVLKARQSEIRLSEELSKSLKSK